MLERVMRRLGVTRQERVPTCLDTLRHALSNTFSELAVAGESVNLIKTTARAIYLLEPKPTRNDLRDPADPESHAAYWSYLRLLRDNEMLPAAGQLAEKEIATVRKLLLGDGCRSHLADDDTRSGVGQGNGLFIGEAGCHCQS